jgi:hypothetical protein
MNFEKSLFSSGLGALRSRFLSVLFTLCALILFASRLGAAPTVFFSYGSAPTGPGSTWRCKTDFTSNSLAAFIISSGTTWKNAGFDDSTWLSGPAQIGFADGDENTAVPLTDYAPAIAGTQSAPCYLFRGVFNIADTNAIASVTGEVQYDDGAIVYVNGTQVLITTNLDPAGTLTNYANFNGATAPPDNSTIALDVPLNLLQNGVNTIAVEIHQVNSASTDMTFNLKLQANYPLYISSISRLTNGNVVITGQGAPSQSHTVWVSTNLVSNSWSNLSTVTPPDSGTFIHEDTAAGESEGRFYRVSLP